MLIYLSLIDEPTDKEKFIDLYESYYRLMLYVAIGILHNQEEAEDAVQEACISIAKNIKKIEKPCSKSKNLCVLIVKNKCIDILRKKEKAPTVSFEEAIIESNSDDALEILLKKESEEHIQRAIARLSEKKRVVLQLRYFHEYSQKEIAELLGIPVNTVNMELYRGKQELKDILEGTL